ncbi:ICMT-domain-containing protein [Cubamyces menziesii]|uniref:Protein-S-isoprenylcysteine O-methyltransferase n=1 Tax=Trametes cubensis TaxID=1111947 RepID=A0AAD7U1Q9_9APHY|nr:ICMT-domain-containing protein [Cubamyces menziesii]KAJ8496160.1 hypothetical protein ONZ51_g1267 [Trametes cubensis]
MAFIITPILTTPLLKVPILLGVAACHHATLKPPHSSEPLKMHKEFRLSDYLTSGTTFQLVAAMIMRETLIGLSVTEAATILAREFSPGYCAHLAEQARALLYPNTHYPLDLHATPMFLTGTALTFLGCTLRLSCYRALGRFFKWQSTVEDDHELITTGPYAVVRHPSYTALLLISIGAPLALLGPGSYARETGFVDTLWGKAVLTALFGSLATVTGALILRIGEEDEELQKKFGGEWLAWSSRTPYKLIPYVY